MVIVSRLSLVCIRWSFKVFSFILGVGGPLMNSLCVLGGLSRLSLVVLGIRWSFKPLSEEVLKDGAQLPFGSCQASPPWERGLRHSELQPGAWPLDSLGRPRKTKKSNK
ncbi:hypothetical protein ACTFIZ_010211 [Dictyostelium cf. discoideum]